MVDCIEVGLGCALSPHENRLVFICEMTFYVSDERAELVHGNVFQEYVARDYEDAFEFSEDLVRASGLVDFRVEDLVGFCDVPAGIC